MYVLKVWPGGADVSLTAEECGLLTRIICIAELGRVDEALAKVMGAAFRALSEAGFARVCLEPDGIRHLEEWMDEFVY